MRRVEKEKREEIGKFGDVSEKKKKNTNHSTNLVRMMFRVRLMSSKSTKVLVESLVSLPGPQET